MRFLGQNDRQARLADLYRAAEQGEAVREIDPDLRSAFEADQKVMRALDDLAARSVPASPAIGRAKLLAAVAGRNSQSPENTGPGTMIGKLLTGRGLALLATAGIFVGGAATVGASGGVGGAADRVSSVLQAAHLLSGDATATPGGAAALSAVSTDTPGPDSTQTVSAGGAPHGCTPTATTTVDTTNTPTATDTPGPTTTAESGHGNGPRNGDCDVRGIPTDNPNFTPEANGTCEKGESAVKTTPSGIMVNVPCQAIDHGRSHDEGTPTPTSGTVTADATESDSGTPSHGNQGGNSGDHNQSGDHRP